MERASVYVKSCESQKVFVNVPHEFSSASGSIKIPDNHRPLSTAKGELEQENNGEFERTNTKKKSPVKSHCSFSGNFVYRHHEGARITLYEPDGNMSTIFETH